MAPTWTWEVPGPPGAPALLLLHGWMATAALNWYGALEYLGGSFRVVAPNLRGHGRAGRGTPPFISRVVPTTSRLSRLSWAWSAPPSLATRWAAPSRRCWRGATGSLLAGSSSAPRHRRSPKSCGSAQRCGQPAGSRRWRPGGGLAQRPASSPGGSIATTGPWPAGGHWEGPGGQAPAMPSRNGRSQNARCRSWLRS